MKQKAQITFEQQETVVLRQADSHVTDFCTRCDTEVLFITPEILAAMTGSSEREVFRLVESGVIHFVETKRTYACSQCYRNAIEQRLPIPEASAARELEE